MVAICLLCAGQVQKKDIILFIFGKVFIGIGTEIFRVKFNGNLDLCGRRRRAFSMAINLFIYLILRFINFNILI